MNGWKDIASAPRDGTRFVAWVPLPPEFGLNDGMQYIVWWSDHTWGFTTDGRNYEEATHWHPLIPSPHD